MDPEGPIAAQAQPQPQSSTEEQQQQLTTISTPNAQDEKAVSPTENISTPLPARHSRLQKVLILSLVTAAASLSTISSNIYFPILPTLSDYFSVSITLINLTVTTYMILQGLSPTLWGALSDSFGRRVVYVATLTIYVGACIGLSESRRYYELLVLRAVQSAGSASTIALGAGVVGDVTTREERGGYMGIYQGGLLIPLAAGPILGGGLAGALGWRSVFWALVILGGTVLVALGLFLPETLKGLKDTQYWYTLRPIDVCFGSKDEVDKDVERVASNSGKSTKKVKLDFWTPFKVVLGGEVTCIILFLALYYTVWQMTITAMSTLFATTYSLTSTQIGLTFIANGAGCIIGTVITGKLMDMDYARAKKSYTGPVEDFPLEKARLRTVWAWSAMQIASTLVFGWTLDKGVHISVPIIATFFLGWAATSTQSVVTTFLVDVFSGRSASATAALNMARCLLGAGGTAAIIPMTRAMTVGWTFTFWTLSMFLALGLVYVQMRCGAKWRKQREAREMKA